MIMAKYYVEVSLVFSDYIEASSEEEAIADAKEACRMNGTWEIFSEESEEE
jgi:hypothetical protein